MKKWNSVNELLAYLNQQKIKYVVLRNFEDLENENIIINHGDIDFLCDNIYDFINTIQAEKKSGENDCVHYIVNIGEESVPIDVRVVGDDYYDNKWEINILEHRVMYKDICYIPDSEDYFYALCYHAILQKKSLSEEYKRKLVELNRKTEAYEENQYVQMINEFMKTNGYKYCYPYDRGVFFRISLIDRSLLKWNRKEFFYRSKIAIYNYIKQRFSFLEGGKI